MKLNTKFSPLLFQGTLAAGGITLMPFNFLQFALPHGKGLIKFSDIDWGRFTSIEYVLYMTLVAIMLIFIFINFFGTLFLLKELVLWLKNKGEYNEFVNDSFKNVGIFSPITSLAMTANVIWAPLGFFIPQVSLNLQNLMLPSLIFFIILWFTLLSLELKVIKIWLTNAVDMKKFTFTWLLDAFSFALVSLMGSGIAATSNNYAIASTAAFGSLFTLSIGFFILIIKLVYLIYLQIKSEKLPDKAILPAYFTIIPVTCLFSISFYRIMIYIQNHFAIEMKGMSFFIINFSYVITIAWGIFTLYLISDYIKKDFINSHFSPPQWGMVCALVGTQVLGVYVNGFYFKHSLLTGINYISIIMAVFIFFTVLNKFNNFNCSRSKNL